MQYVIGMVADARDFPDPEQTDITVERIGIEHAELWASVTADGWNTPPAARARFFMEVERALRKNDPRGHYFIARLGGTPVGTGVINCVDDFAHFNGSVVLEQYRRRGIYRALIYERMKFVRGLGVTSVTNTCVSDTSAPICARLGFRTAADFEIYRHPGGSVT